MNKYFLNIFLKYLLKDILWGYLKYLFKISFLNVFLNIFLKDLLWGLIKCLFIGFN